VVVTPVSMSCVASPGRPVAQARHNSSYCLSISLY
jgi:hypothetical protein